MKEQFTIEGLNINTKEDFISGEDVMYFMEEMYGMGLSDTLDKVYEDIKWNKWFIKEEMLEVKKMVLKAHLGE